jgi:alkylation response protein AidB-like acyl-CoA dehydrogenase
MMIPERLGTAAMTLGPARAALDIATQYSSRRISRKRNRRRQRVSFGARPR